MKQTEEGKCMTNICAASCSTWTMVCSELWNWFGNWLLVEVSRMLGMRRLSQLLEFLITRPGLGAVWGEGKSPLSRRGVCRKRVPATATVSGCEGTLCLPLMWLAACSLGLGVCVVQHCSQTVPLTWETGTFGEAPVAQDAAHRLWGRQQLDLWKCVYAIQIFRETYSWTNRTVLFCFLMKMFCRNIVILNVNMSTCWCSENFDRTTFLKHVLLSNI